jgi:hypothetical protein
MKMDTYNAVGILDGFVEPESAEDVIAAARFIRDHGPRGVLAGNGTRDAIALADLADRDEDAALDHVRGA